MMGPDASPGARKPVLVKTLQKKDKSGYRPKTSTSKGWSAHGSPLGETGLLKFASNGRFPARAAALTA